MSNSVKGPGWFKASRNPHMSDIVKACPNAFILAYAIAYRTRWNQDAPNPFDLELGEAVCDYQNWGLTQQQFRTAKAKLEKWKIATFKSTNRGTIGRLVNTELFDVVGSRSNEQNNEPATTYQEQRAFKSKEKEIGSGSKPDVAASAPQEKTPEPATEKPSMEVGMVVGTPYEPYDIPSPGEVRAYGDRRGHELDAVAVWLEQRERDNWTIRGEPIKWWKLALDEFAEKFQLDRASRFCEV